MPESFPTLHRPSLRSQWPNRRCRRQPRPRLLVRRSQLCRVLSFGLFCFMSMSHLCSLVPLKHPEHCVYHGTEGDLCCSCTRENKGPRCAKFVRNMTTKAQRGNLTTALRNWCNSWGCKDSGSFKGETHDEVSWSVTCSTSNQCAKEKMIKSNDLLMDVIGSEACHSISWPPWLWSFFVGMVASTSGVYKSFSSLIIKNSVYV